MTWNYSLFLSEEIFVLFIQLIYCLSEKKTLHDELDEFDSLKHIWFIAKRSQTKIIHKVEIWSTGREINSAVLHSTNEAEWSILKVFYTKNGSNIEAELKIEMKVLNKEQAIVYVYSLEKKIFWAISFMIFPAFFSAQ